MKFWKITITLTSMPLIIFATGPQPQVIGLFQFIGGAALDDQFIESEFNHFRAFSHSL